MNGPDILQKLGHDNMILLILSCLFSCGISLSVDQSFSHNVDYTSDDSGERFKLHSAGVITDVIDLDTVSGIKRLLCVGERLLLVTDDDDVGKEWRVGHIMVASSRWRCNSTHNSPGTGVYVRIATIHFPTDRRLSIHTVPAGPLDMIHQANIHFRYTPGRRNGLLETRQRHRRYLSNILTKMLGRMDYQANFSTTIPFNEDEEGNVEKQFSVRKSWGDETLDFEMSNKTDSQDPDFLVECIACHGLTDMSYIFELTIKKINNKPKVIKYLSQFEGETTVETEMATSFTREMGVNYSRSLWGTEPMELLRIPLVVVREVPPVYLALSYSTHTLAHVHGYSRRAALVRTGFTATGKYTLSQKSSESSPNVHGDISSMDWEARSSNDSLDYDVTDTLNITVDIYQKIVFNASISWRARDIMIDLSPPMEITIRPKLKLETDVVGHSQCLESSLRIDGAFNIARSELEVEAFGISIWDVVLSPEISRQTTLTQSTLWRRCSAHCVGELDLGPPLSDVQVCGQMTARINRGTPEFKSLQVLHGNELVFSSEEDGSVWCGEEGTPCFPCNDTSNSSSICADRYMTARLASAITKLSLLVQAEWPEESLVILKAWDEASSEFPNGQDGNTSLHYEGRAADVTVTGVHYEDNLLRFGSLAVCSGFDFVEIQNETSSLHVAVNVDGFRAENDKLEAEMFADMFHNGGSAESSKKCAREAPGLKVGDTVPDNQRVEDVCGPPQGALDRVNSRDMDRLYYYDKDDVEFSPEGADDEACGHSTRRCRSDCSLQDKLTEPWTWCSTRIMTPRLALKLTQLAKLANAEGIEFQITKAFTEDGNLTADVYFREGRGLVIQSKPTNPSSAERLAVLAACSGFDFIHYRTPTSIEVSVRSHGGVLATRVEFPDEDATRLAVDPPPHEDLEYEYPPELRDEVVTPQLVSGFDSDSYLSEHYMIRDFLSPNRLYFRVDTALLMCLDLVSDSYGQKIEIVPGSGYKTRSVNMINYDLRHPEELLRLQAGLAVEVRPPRYRHTKDLLTLAKEVIRRCSPFLIEEMRGLGIGCHPDRLYVDIRPVEAGRETDYITTWVTNDFGCTFADLFDLAQQLKYGGPVVAPYVKDTCRVYPLGRSKFYLTFQFNQAGLCSTDRQSSFCSATLRYRKEESRKLQERMTSSAGAECLPRRDIRKQLDKCTVTLCGGCPASGSVWDQKVKACSLVVDRFITRATRAFPDLADRATFFNTEAVESSVHYLACHDGNVCIENIQLYSLFMPLVTSRYRPDPTGSIERMMFSSDRNPTPLLELVEQEMAFRASGKVKVFIEQQTDLKYIRNIIKILMVYNRNITTVEFHIADDLDKDIVAADLQRNLEVWAGTTCPEDSRFAIAPFSVHQVSHARRKRSLARSEHRNEARRRVHQWEMDWMMKLL